jgi:hypothetical protein
MKHPNLWLCIAGFCVMIALPTGLMNLLAILAFADLPLPSMRILRLIVGGTVFVSLGVGFSIMVIALIRTGQERTPHKKNTDFKPM